MRRQSTSPRRSRSVLGFRLPGAPRRASQPDFSSGSVDDSASTGGTRPLAPPPPDTCLVLKHLVDFLLKNKLHKDDLFLADAKPNELKKLRQYVHQGHVPEKLGQYSSRSVSFLILDMLKTDFTPLLPSGCVNPRDERVENTTNAARALLSVLPEQRALLESLLLLLYKLSLKNTTQMNTCVLGEVVAAHLLAHDHERVDANTAGEFLLGHAPEIIREIRRLQVQQVTIEPKGDTPSEGHPEKRHSGLRRISKSIASAKSSVKRHMNLQHEQDPEGPSHPLPLTRRSARRIVAVLTTIVNCSHNKHGLFISVPPTMERSVDRVKQFLLDRENAYSDEQSGVWLPLLDPQVLARGVYEFLRELAPPLLCAELSTPATEANASTQLHEMIEKVPKRIRDVVELLLGVVRIAVDSQTDVGALRDALAPCFLPMESPGVEVYLDELFLRIPVVLGAVLERKRQRLELFNQLYTAFVAVVWTRKLIRRWKRRQAETLTVIKEEETEDANDELAHRLCFVVELLLDQTRAYPMQLRRLYLDAGDELEVRILVQMLLNERQSRVSLELFSPHSLAMAVQTIIDTSLTPLGKSPVQRNLRRLLEAHVELLLKHEPYRSVRCELENVFEEFLLSLDDSEGNADQSINRHDNRTHRIDQMEPIKVNTSRSQKPVAVDTADLPKDHVARHGTASPGSGVEKSSEQVIQEQPPEEPTTLSQWLARQPTENGRGPTQPVLNVEGYAVPVLELLQSRMDDICFVAKHCQLEPSERREWTSQGLLRSILRCLRIPSVLLAPASVESALARIDAVNRTSTIKPNSLLPLCEVVEALVTETTSVLQHPVLAPLYPSPMDQLFVLLDVWGLADRTIVTETPTRPQAT